MRRILLLSSLLTLLAGPAAEALDCSAAAQREMSRLGLTSEQLGDIRYVQQYNPTDRGPDVLGVRAWVRLKSCSSGYLVIDMTRTCFVRQSYTRGECRLEGVTAY